jgi:hypothetical protein
MWAMIEKLRILCCCMSTEGPLSGGPEQPF